MNKSRVEWIDVCRGLLMILVVFGHSAFIQHYSEIHKFIYWFHMPAFFVLSGLLHKSPSEWNQFRPWVKFTIKKIMFIYLVFIGIITVYRYLITPMNYSDAPTELKNIILGGRFIEGYYAPVWFITCLMATQLLFATVLMIKSSYVRWGLIIGAYVAAHLQTTYFPSIKIVGDIDVSLFAIFFYALGYFFRRWLIDDKIALICIVAFIGIIYLDKHGKIQYFLDMKQHGFNHPLYDLIIPIFGTVSIFAISNMFVYSPFNKFLQLVGRNSLIIMYLHLLIAVELYRLDVYKSVFLFVVIGVGVPILVSEIIKYIRHKQYNLNRLS